MRDIVQAFISLIHRYPLLKYDNSSPMAFIGLDLLDKSDTTPKLTSILLSRPSHIKETSLLVDALALTTPYTSSHEFAMVGGCIDGDSSSTEESFEGVRLIQYSAPIVHSLS